MKFELQFFSKKKLIKKNRKNFPWKITHENCGLTVVGYTDCGLYGLWVMGCGLSIWVIRTVGCFPRGLYSRRPTSRFSEKLKKKVESDLMLLIKHFIRK